MTAIPRSARFWRDVRQLPDRIPLRTKLITALLALVAIALVVISVAGIGFLRDNLLAPYDSTLATYASRPGSFVNPFLAQNQAPESAPLPDFAAYWIPARGTVHPIYTPFTIQFAGRGATNVPIPGPTVQSAPAWIGAHINRPFTLSAQTGSGHWRVIMQIVPLNNGSYGTLAIALDVSSVYATAAKLALIDLLISLVIIALLGIVGVAVIRASLRPLTEIEQTAGAIAAGDLSRRVPERDPRTEMGRLGRSLNTMLSQVETAFRARSTSEAAARRSEERMRQFVADASHELRTPLTAIRGFAEYYRQRGGITDAPVPDAPIPQALLDEAAALVGRNGTGKLTPGDLDRIMRRVEQESARMGVLVEDMLLLARLDQQRPLDRGTVDLLTLAADAVHDARVVAPGRSIHLTVSSGAALLVNGDEVRLRQVIGNLMSNALSHTPAGTPIDVLIRSGSLAEVQSADAAPDSAYAVGASASGARAQAAAVLEVTDHGPGLTREQAEHAFERFYRADQARTSGGTGLGLAIVAALVDAHGGAVWVRSRPGEGATFSIALPLTPEAVEGKDDEDQTAEPDAISEAPADAGAA